MIHSIDRHLVRLVLPILALLFAGPASAQSTPQGHIDPTTWVSTPEGPFDGIAHVRYEAMFEGVTGNQRPFRVPCQIMAPANSAQASGLMLFDWPVASTILTVVGQEQADARYTLTDEFLFGQGVAYATVRCDITGIGTESPDSDSTRPWSDDLLDTSSEFITSAGDEFDIVVMYLNALRTDPLALQALGTIERRAAFGYSLSGYRLRGLLRRPAGIGQFDFSLVGGTGNGFDHPAGNKIAFSNSERDPLPGAGLEIDFQTETDVVVLGAHKTRRERANYRVYQFAGASHIRDVDVDEFGLADPESANNADWLPFIRALFVAGNNWCDGIQPPPSLWLGAPNDSTIARDANGNALVTHVGGQPVPTTAYRLPEVAVGENQYIPYAPSYDDGTFLGMFRSLAGGHVDLTDNFTSHAGYVNQITLRAQELQSLGYLLAADADLDHLAGERVQHRQLIAGHLLEAAHEDVLVRWLCAGEPTQCFVVVVTKRFTGEIYAGHTTDCGVLVPFDPSKLWKGVKPLPIGYRKHVGYAVRGTVDGKPFESWIFHYFHEWRLVVPEGAMAAAKVAAGDSAKFAVRPHANPEKALKFAPGPKR